MRQYLTRKKRLIGAISISFWLAACTNAPVACHQFTPIEDRQIAAAVHLLPPDAPLRWVDRDYQRVCEGL